ncbi:hypothetical protein RND81_01G098800 [Saponaria officinalis]|uniref:Uncharacterized protein n=1 Tax=Saponaria officinalis TaxID=3572 RepID=A0AAW1NDE8_SAPOF
MDVSGSGWSSGCESGWTGYLDESYVPRNEYSGNYDSYRLNYCNGGDEVEEDLSMVSDASSGPQHFQNGVESRNSRSSRSQNNCLTSVKSSKKSGDKRSKKSVGKEQKLSLHQNVQYSFSSNHLDDTASSTAMTYSKMFENHSPCNQASVDHYTSFPQGVSENHYQVRTVFIACFR